MREVGQETFRLYRQYVDEILLVDTDNTCAATAGQTLVAIACGANMNFDRLRDRLLPIMSFCTALNFLSVQEH